MNTEFWVSFRIKEVYSEISVFWACRPGSWLCILERNWNTLTNLKNSLLEKQTNQPSVSYSSSSFVGALHLKFYLLADTWGKKVFENQSSVVLKDEQNRIYSHNIECTEMLQSSKQRSPIKIKEGNGTHLTSQPVSNASGSLLPMKQGCLQTDDKNYFSPQMMMLWSVDLNWDNPLCSALGWKHRKCIYNWTASHYTVTSYRDLLFSSRDKVSMPARQYNCLFHLSVHERLLSLLWFQPRQNSSWSWVECHGWEWRSHTGVCWTLTHYVQLIPVVMLI